MDPLHGLTSSTDAPRRAPRDGEALPAPPPRGRPRAEPASRRPNHAPTWGPRPPTRPRPTSLYDEQEPVPDALTLSGSTAGGLRTDRGATGTLDVATEAATWLLSTNGGFENGENFATTLGDWDGDGFDDLVMTSPWFVREEDREGASYGDLVYTGALFLLAGPVAPGVVDLEVQADRVENRALAGWEFGLDDRVVGGHDLDFDGHPDLVVGDSGDQYPGIWTRFGGGR